MRCSPTMPSSTRRSSTRRSAARSWPRRICGAAFQVFFNPTFRYVREIVGPSDAMLEFETELDGVLVNGVDIIKWNDAGKIVEFKVMLRPLKAINLIHQRMAAMLQSG